VMRRCAAAPVPLVFRGVITVGDCFLDEAERALIGPAVDEAAELMNQAEGAFVWLSPDANTLDYGRCNVGGWKGLLMKFTVPLKKGQAFNTRVVNPFVHTSVLADEFWLIKSGYRRAMAVRRPDVAIKRANTKPLLDAFEQASQRHLANKRAEAHFRERMRNWKDPEDGQDS
jgi:hypothetical protein